MAGPGVSRPPLPTSVSPVPRGFPASAAWPSEGGSWLAAWLLGP